MTLSKTPTDTGDGPPLVKTLTELNDVFFFNKYKDFAVRNGKSKFYALVLYNNVRQAGIRYLANSGNSKTKFVPHNFKHWKLAQEIFCNTTSG